ncbi:hypothetical protein ACFQS7_05985 [Dankookia sp. GCM10030260]|uniref:hypothetical protein n=1 Tax=Dankookia sp. GCM10030260 TaxID=3273390 RepID=UPI00360EE88E
MPLTRSPPQTSSGPVSASAEVQLCVMVPPAVRSKVRAAAKARGLTLRALVLSALRDAGVLEGLSEVEFADRRASLAAAKARLWREHTAAATDAPDASQPALPRSGDGSA